jgi:colicin import membrane protein
MTTAITEATSMTTADPFRFGWRFVTSRVEGGGVERVKVPLTYEDVLHPMEEDVVVQNTAHQPDVAYLQHACKWILNGRPDVRVWSDLRIDWGVPGVDPHGPDVAVFVEAHTREPTPLGTYRPKEFGAKPILVIEVTSPATRSQDLHDKVLEYHRTGVPFYALVDYLPEFDLTRALVLGYRATPQGYLRLPLDEGGRLWLEPLGLWLGWKQGGAVCFDERNNPIPGPIEAKHQIEASDRRNEELQQQLEETVTALQESEKRTRDLAARLAEAEAKLGGQTGQPP